MLNFRKSYKNYYFLISFFLFAVVMQFFVRLPEEQIVLVGVLSIGLPFVFLVINKSSRGTAIILLFISILLLGILKAITGSRFAPLTFDLCILLACIASFTENIANRKIRFDKLDLLLLLFLLFAFVEMFNPNVPSLQAGIEGFRKFAYMSIALYVGRHIIQEKELRLLNTLIILISIPIVLYGIKQFFFMSELDYKMINLATAGETTYMMGGHLRPFSTMPGPFHLGSFIVISILLTIILMQSRYRGKLTIQLILLIGVVFQIIVLFLTRTKSNWIALVVGILVLVFLHINSSHPQFLKNISLKLFGIMLSAFFIIPIILIFISGTALEVLETALYNITHISEAPTFVYRLGLWEEIFTAISNKPIIGYGTSSAGEGLYKLYLDTNAISFASHNIYFKVLIEMGFLGLFIFIFLIIISLKKGWRFLSKTYFLSNEILVTFYLAFSVVIAFLIGGLAYPVLDAYPVNYYFWLLLGVLTNKNIHEKYKIINSTMKFQYINESNHLNGCKT